MAVERLTPDKVWRRLGSPNQGIPLVFDWKQLVFQECITFGKTPEGETIRWNPPDPAVVSRAIPALLHGMGVTSVLATIVAPDRVVFVPDDENQEVVDLDPRREQVWWREEAMAQMPPPHRAALTALFHEAGVRRRFRGGIIARGQDCLRVAGLLAIYAFDVCSDVLLLCEGISLAIKACHEADIHVYSQDDAVLASCTTAMRALGFRPYLGEPQDTV